MPLPRPVLRFFRMKKRAEFEVPGLSPSELAAMLPGGRVEFDVGARDSAEPADVVEPERDPVEDVVKPRRG